MRKVIVLNHHQNLAVRIRNYIDFFIENGLLVDCILPSQKIIPRFKNKRIKNEIQGKNLYVERFYIPDKFLFMKFIYIYLVMSKKVLREPVEIILCTNIKLLPLAIFLGKIKKAKVIHDSCEIPSVTIRTQLKHYLPNALANLFAILFHRIEMSLSHHPDYILTTDSKENMLYKKFVKVNVNTQVIYNVPSIKVPIDKVMIEQLKHKFKNAKIIIYAGNIKKSTGFQQYLDVYGRLNPEIKDLNLLFIGNMEDSIKRHYIFKEENGIKFIDWIPYEEMLCYLSISQIGLALLDPEEEKFRLLSKGNSRKIFTYMYSGIPIIASRMQYASIIKENKCGFLVNYDDIDEIASRIIYLLKNPEVANAMGERGKAAIFDKYNFEIEKSKLKRLFGQILQ